MSVRVQGLVLDVHFPSSLVEREGEVIRDYSRKSELRYIVSY